MKWRGRFLSHQQLCQHISELSDRRTLLTFFRHWKTKFVESRQQKWRNDMRHKMKIVQQNHTRRLIQEAFSRWRLLSQSQLAFQGYLERLLARSYISWKHKMERIAQLHVTAEEIYQNTGGTLVATCWNKWKRVVELRSAEAMMRERVGLRILDKAFTQWGNYM